MRIFALEDESFAMAPYFDALEKAGHHVTRFEGVDAAREGLNQKAPDLLILDVMMAPGSYGSERTEQGLKTGLVYLAEFREKHPLVPVLILTNVDRSRLLGELTEGSRTRILQKLEILPEDLPPIAAAFLRVTS